MNPNELNQKTQDAARVTCPECGETFSSRGLPGHRRMRHGTVVARAKAYEPPALLPSQQPVETIEFLPQLVRAFDELLVLLRKLETHLTRHDEARERAAMHAVPGGDTVARSLEQSLGNILAEISRIEANARERSTAWGGSPPSPEARELEETTYTEIGKLRRKQAHLLFRLRELRGQDASDALCS
jgi:hypothetical protein